MKAVGNLEASFSTHFAFLWSKPGPGEWFVTSFFPKKPILSRVLGRIHTLIDDSEFFEVPTFSQLFVNLGNLSPTISFVII